MEFNVKIKQECCPEDEGADWKSVDALQNVIFKKEDNSFEMSTNIETNQTHNHELQEVQSIKIETNTDLMNETCLDDYIITELKEEAVECTDLQLDEKTSFNNFINPDITIEDEIKQSGTYKCPICHKVFTTNETLLTHLDVHTKNKQYKCSICDKFFYDKHTLKRHFLVHSEIKAFKCTSCDKAFSLRGNLKRHLLLHSGDKPFKCTICDRAFSDQTILKGHLLVHSGDKPFKCTICDKAFTQKTTLTNHLSFHKGIRPFKCTHCEKAYIRKSHLAKHLLTHSKK